MPAQAYALISLALDYALMPSCWSICRLQACSAAFRFCMEFRLRFMPPLVMLFCLTPYVVRGNCQSLPEPPTQSATEIQRFDVGLQAIDMRLGTCFATRQCETPQLGIGIRGDFYIKSFLSVGAEFSTLVHEDSSHLYYSDGSAAGGRATEFLLGPEVTERSSRYRFLIFARPGLVSWSKVVSGVSAEGSGYDYARKTSLAGDLGGGIEVSPARRLHVALEVGDLLVRYDDSRSLYCNACVAWTNNLQITAVTSLSFGQTLRESIRRRDSADVHRFLDKPNILLITASLLGQSADAITTQRNRQHGHVEEDPLAAPFVKYGWSGQLGLAAIANSLEIFGMYGLHKMGAHRIERAVPISVGTASGIAAYRNLQ